MSDSCTGIGDAKAEEHDPLRLRALDYGSNARPEWWIHCETIDECHWSTEAEAVAAIERVEAAIVERHRPAIETALLRRLAAELQDSQNVQSDKFTAQWLLELAETGERP